MEKLYKVLVDGKSCHGGDFEWDLPKKKNNKWVPGKWTKRIKKDDLEICDTGYHVMNDPIQWIKTGCTIYECEVKTIKEWENDKCVCGQVRLLKPFGSNNGKDNIGHYNIGHYNTGDRNTGYLNTGDLNTGDLNTGYLNTGDLNTGDRNTGDRNTGYLNTGDRNTGYRNTGDRNTGDRNTGEWNSGDFHTGYFNTTKEPPFLMFNKPCDISREDINFPDYFYFEVVEWVDDEEHINDGKYESKDYKETFKESFNQTSKENIEKTLKLPNFDYKIFEEISGITKEMIEERIK